MISRAMFCIDLTFGELRTLVHARKCELKWTDSSTKDIINKIRFQLREKQLRCAYCGLSFGLTNSQIDHIAPKSKYKKYTFTLRNLVLACGLCNGFEKKSSKNTINVYHPNSYKKCDFLIVHPYFHEPVDHFVWMNDFPLILDEINSSTKALNSIKIFELNTYPYIVQRAKEISYLDITGTLTLTIEERELIKAATSK